MTCLPSCTFRFLNVWANAPYGNNSVANRSPARKGDTMNGSSSSRLTIVRLHIHSPTHEALYDLETLARLAGVHPTLVSKYIRLVLLDPLVEEGRGEHEWRFDDGSLHILRRIQRLRSELGININGVAVVLELLRQINDLQRELAHPPDE